jgi:hypothetical protein
MNVPQVRKLMREKGRVALSFKGRSLAFNLRAYFIFV